VQKAQDIKALADDKQRRVFLHQNGNQSWYLGQVLHKHAGGRAAERTYRIASKRS
jgi:hypothetical protein